MQAMKGLRCCAVKIATARVSPPLSCIYRKCTLLVGCVPRNGDKALVPLGALRC